MAVIRRNAGWWSLTGLIVCTALLVVWWVAPRPAPAVAPAALSTAVASPWFLQSYEPLDEVAAAHIDELRRENGLDDDTLAALDLTAQQLETALASARSWYETNQAQWLSERAAVADQKALIRRLRSEINMGNDELAALAAAKQQLAQLEAQYETLVAGLRDAAWTGLSASQQTLADWMRGRREIPMPFRVPQLTDAQDRDLKHARSRYHQRLSVVRDAQARASIRGDFEQALESAIGTENVQALATLAGYRGAASERVLTAVQTVLPVEEG